MRCVNNAQLLLPPRCERAELAACSTSGVRLWGFLRRAAPSDLTIYDDPHGAPSAPPSLAYHWARNAAAAARYCGPECQAQHWKEGGRDLSESKRQAAPGSIMPIRDTRAVTVAAERARRTPRAGVLLCRPSTGKRRRASCACVRAAGRRASHMSCERSSGFCDEAEENNLGGKAFDAVEAVGEVQPLRARAPAACGAQVGVLEDGAWAGRRRKSLEEAR